MKKSNKSSLIFTILSITMHAIVLFYPISYAQKKENLLKEKKVIDNPVIKVEILSNEKKAFLLNLDQLEDSLEANHSSILSNKNVISEDALNLGENLDHFSGRETENQEDNLNIKDNPELNGSSGKISISSSKFKYFDYYIDIKKSFEEKWKDTVRGHIGDLSIDKELELKTVLILQVQKNGIIKDILIGESSGSRELDKIAISLFKNQAIPSPPEEILNQKDFIYLYWGFTIKL